MATALKQPAIETIDLTPNIGTEIRADKATLLSGVHAAELRARLEARGVLVFREIGFDDQEQIAFTKTLGTYAAEGGDGKGGIYKITMDKTQNAQADYLKGAFYWHLDGTQSETPILASLLSAKQLAPEGGDTEFASTYAAYDALSDEDKAEIDALKVVHSLEYAQLMVFPEPSYAQLMAWRALGGQTLPLVWKHRSGRKSLIVGGTASYVVGKTPEESVGTLVRLRDHATKPEFVYRHQWTVGDLVIWDNTGTLHRAMPYALDSGRMMHRTKLEGEEAFG